MLEWLKRHAWKACIPPKGIRGSNPRLSAFMFKGSLFQGFLYLFSLCTGKFRVSGHISCPRNTHYYKLLLSAKTFLKRINQGWIPRLAFSRGKEEGTRQNRKELLPEFNTWRKRNPGKKWKRDGMKTPCRRTKMPSI